MRLVLFDIDDTLTRSQYADSPFIRVMSEAFGVDEIDTDWERYPHASDTAIVRSLLERHRGRSTPEDIMRLHDLYLETLGADTPAFTQVPGAAAALDHLVAAGHAVAIATGNWNAVGRLKLQAAGLPADRFPLAGCTGIESREAIMEDGIRRAESVYGVTSFSRVVYVGDADWDVRATRALALPLVGVADPAERLRSQGVSHVIPDYRDLTAFEHALQHARAPDATPAHGM